MVVSGVNVAVMGGVAIFTGVYFQQNYVGIVLAAAGQCFLVAGKPTDRQGGREGARHACSQGAAAA